MPPKKRNPENAGLPKLWRWKNGAYRYLVPKGSEHYWDGKTEFKLGVTQSQAHRVFADRLAPSEDAKTMEELIDRYLAEVTPEKTVRTRKDEPPLFFKLRAIFGSSDPSSIKPHHIYKVYDSLQQHGLTSANRHMEKLSHLFTKAIEWGGYQRPPNDQQEVCQAAPYPA